MKKTPSKYACSKNLKMPPSLLGGNSLPVLLYLSAFNLIFGNIAVIIFSMIGALPRKYYHLLPWAALNPVYWILQSVGAYKALWQLITKPYYWEKTNHGISKYQTEQIQKPVTIAS